MSNEEARYAVFSAIETGEKLEHDVLIVCEKALEKRIGKKLIDFEALTYMKIGRCPCCDALNNNNMNYCGICGQRLDWSVNVNE